MGLKNKVRINIMTNWYNKNRCIFCIWAELLLLNQPIHLNHNGRDPKPRDLPLKEIDNVF